MHNRLHQRRFPLLEALLVVGGLAALPGCDEATGPLAEYRGSRALELLRVTAHYTPDVQWVGGKVAVIGVNRGPRAALDETLVWLRTSGENDIASYVTVKGAESDPDAVSSFGGTPVDSLDDGTEYTFWLAERDVFDAGLVDTLGLGFADTTLTVRYLLLGRSGGDRNLGVSYRVVREETLLGERFIIDWTPATQGFQTLAIREATTGGWDKLKWHLLVPGGTVGAIMPPLVIGEAPDGITEAIPWPSTGFATGAHTIWAVTEDWTDGDFSFRGTGYAFFQVFASNFPEED
jgi:hypothetical protein